MVQTLKVNVGDKLIWLRQGHKLKCTVLDVRPAAHRNDVTRMQIRVEGWVGTHWETLDYSFEPATV